MLNDGTWVFYVLEHRLTARTKWPKPDTPLRKVKVREWDLSSKDFFGQNTDHGVWSVTGYHGWWNLDDAKASLTRVRLRSEAGAFDVKDPFSHRVCQRQRHEFRIAKMTITKTTEVVK